MSGPPHVLEAVEPGFLAQVGRDLIRSGDSLHVIDVHRDGRVTLLPCSSWHFEGDAHPRTWTVRATFYGPSTSTTRHLPFDGVVFVRWGSTPAQPYVGTGPLSWAHTTARLQSETERSLPMRRPVLWRSCLPCRRMGEAMAEMTRSRCSRRTSEVQEARPFSWKPWRPDGGEGKTAAPRRDWQLRV